MCNTYVHNYAHYLQQCVVTVLTPCKRNLSNDTPYIHVANIVTYVDSAKVYWYIHMYVRTCVTLRVCIHMLYDRI